MTENQRKIYEILKSNGSWMSTEDIINKGNFEKWGPAICCLIFFVKQGYVEKQTQNLPNGNTMGFYRLIKKFEPKKLWFVEKTNCFGISIEIRSFSSKAEAFKYIDFEKFSEHDISVGWTYSLYEAQEAGEY